MIYLITDIDLIINYPYIQIKHLDDITHSPTLLLIDYNKIQFDNLRTLTITYPKLRTIALNDSYIQQQQIVCYQNDIYQYLFDKEILNDHISHIINRLNKKFKILHSVTFSDDNKSISTDNIHINLPKKEYIIFKYLYLNKDRICTQQEILTKVLGYHENSETRLVSVYIRYIRKKLETTSIDIKTIRKQGYKIILKDS